jgi:hypothetical protein
MIREEFSVTDYVKIFRAHATLLHDLKDLDEFDGVLRGAASALGLLNPLGIIWEAIPFSFLVDWVSKLGTQIDRLKVQPFIGQWTLSDVHYSVKEQARVRCDQRWYQTVSPGLNPLTPVATVDVMLYRRLSGLPLDYSFVKTMLGSQASSKQQWLLLALLTQGLLG